MSVGGNFTTITLGPDDNGIEKLNVNGVTERPHDVKALYVAVAHADAEHTLAGPADPDGSSHELPSTSVAAPTADGWTTVLDQGQPPYQDGETVLAVGVTVDNRDGSTFFWHQTLTIELDTHG